MKPWQWAAYGSASLAVCVLAGWGSAELAARLAWPQADAGTRLLAFGLGAGMAALPLALWGWLARRVAESGREDRALVLLRPLMGPLPLRLGEPDATAHFLATVIACVERDRPETIVELGAGASTVLIAAALREIGRGRVLAVEHARGGAEATRARLAERGLEAWAEVVEAPLAPREVEGREARWYGPELEAALPERIDLLIVRGPPRRAAREARRPAVPVLAERMAPGGRVLLDEGARIAEATAARAWAGRLGTAAEYVPGGRGAWALRVGEAP